MADLKFGIEDLALRTTTLPALLARLGFLRTRLFVVVVVVVTLALFFRFAIVDPFFEAARRTVVVFFVAFLLRAGRFTARRLRVVLALRFFGLRRAFSNRIWLIP